MPVVPTAHHVLLHAFGVDQQRRALSTETIRVRNVVLLTFALYCRGALLTASKDDVNTWLDSLALVPRSRSKYLSHLHNFYAFCIREGFTEHDPTVAILRPRLPKLLPRPISDADLEVALALAPTKTRAMLSLACYEGLRCMEIAAFDVSWIRVVGDVAVIVITGKGGKQRTVPLAQETENALEDHGMPKRGFVFLTQYGRPYKPNSISARLATYLHGRNIDATAHQLRHWFGTECYRESRDLVLTQELMGHSDANTTRGYVALVPDERAVSFVRGMRVAG